MENSYYPNLFKPLKVGSITLRNRIMSSPFGYLDKVPLTTYWIEHLATRAKGGTSLISIGCCHVDQDRSMIVPDGNGLFQPYLPYYKEQLSAIHQYGAKAAVELFHAGLWARTGDPARPPIGPVDTVRNIGKDADGAKVVGMDLAMMNQVADNFASAAYNARRMGFDLCTLHFAHGWLAAQFLSPKYNTRTDEFGGSIENRMRFPMMIIERIREKVGRDFPLDLRISGGEWIDGGVELEDIITFIKRVESMIDMVQMSSGIDKYYETSVHMITPALYPHKVNVHLAAALKKEVSIPVVTVSGIMTPEDGESVIANGQADAVAVCRALFADPEMPEKIRTGRREDVVPCLRCISCYHVATEHYSMGCAVNPRHMREERLNVDIKPAEHERHVVVVGGGPGGMKAALTAVEMGHRATLIEKEDALGGVLRHICVGAHKEDVAAYYKYLLCQTQKNKRIDLKMNTEATPELVESLKPDFVVVAVGADPIVPNIPGIDRPQVVDVLAAYQMADQLTGDVTIVGGGQAGCELALMLCEKADTVTIVEQSGALYSSANLMYQEALRQLLAENSNISIKMNTTCAEIGEQTVTLRDSDGTAQEIKADRVVISVGLKPRRALAEQFVGCAYDVRMIGDCVSPRKIDEATFEGYFSVVNIK